MSSINQLDIILISSQRNVSHIKSGIVDVKDFNRIPTLVFYSILTLTAVYICLSFVLRKELRDKEGHPLPPGPPIRYAFLRKYNELVLHKWAKQYGGIFSVWMGQQLFVVINDPIIARDLLVTNGSNFSSRWNFFIKNQILQRGAITATPYNETWRKHRKIANWMLAPKAVQSHLSIIDYESHMFLLSLYRETNKCLLPVDPANFAGRYVLNNILSITFGTRTGSVYDPLVKRALPLGHEFMQLTGSLSNAVDFIKPLQYLPLPIRSRGRRLRKEFLEVYCAMIQQVKDSISAGENVPDCLVKRLLDMQESENLSWTEMCMIATAFAVGGTQSATGSILWFLALLPSHKEIQARAHDELDRVIGRERMPTSDDEPQLPCIRAIIKEVLRLYAPFWNATPHCSEHDFVYNGMYIPANTVILLNCYSLHHNEERYPDSFTFNPERYLGDNYSSAESSRLPNPMERDHWSFGAGRRICPGITLAEKELFLAVSRLLWAFRIHALPDEPISLDKYEGKSSRTPLPYRIKLEPRHSGVAKILESRGEETKIFEDIDFSFA